MAAEHDGSRAQAQAVTNRIFRVSTRGGTRMPAAAPVSVKVVLLRGDDLLVLSDAGTGVGDLPGGRLEPGEVGGDWRAALLREIAEELGPDVRCELEPWPRLAFPHRIASTGEEAVGVIYVGRWLAGEPILSDEHDGLTWHPLRDGPPRWLQDTLLAAVSRLPEFVPG